LGNIVGRPPPKTGPSNRLTYWHHLPVSKATGGLLPGIDLTRFSDYQETEDRDYAERLSKGFK
jgi:hypothetical protein